MVVVLIKDDFQTIIIYFPGLMVQSVSASSTDTKFQLGELGVGSNQCPVGHHRDYHVSLTLTFAVVQKSYIQ